MVLDTGKTIEAEPKQVKAAMRQSPIEANPKRSCAACPMSHTELHQLN
jgi:hypothetical protein